MSVELVTGTFEPHVGETFAATPTHSGEPLDLELTSCVESRHARPDHPAFSLFFDSAGEAIREQQIFTLRHADLGEFNLFLVPVGPQQYEAVIN
jgi:hypothetical protein